MDTITFRRSGVDEYSILLGGSAIGTVAKTRSVDLATGTARRPIWVAQAKAAHPFGVTETVPARGRTRGEATSRAVRAYKSLCAGKVVELCDIHRTGRTNGWW